MKHLDDLPDDLEILFWNIEPDVECIDEEGSNLLPFVGEEVGEGFEKYGFGGLRPGRRDDGGEVGVVHWRRKGSEEARSWISDEFRVKPEDEVSLRGEFCFERGLVREMRLAWWEFEGEGGKRGKPK